MDAERWRRVQELFLRAVDLPAAEQQSLLAAECSADAGLRAELERMLAGDGTGDDAFSRMEAHTQAPTRDPRVGQAVGAYQLTERLAAGGMGVVYRGQRTDGLFQQEVAIKLVRSERASDWVVRRFEFERRMLAGLQHPGIARLYDGGTTADGCPYFVMELVRGEAIDRYCARERLSLAARLRLFVQVCRAVHHAHQNLVVHCDLKPSNILIDPRGMPRLLDFGIARLLGEPPQADAAAPRTLACVMTPEYASPEQLAGGAVTTAIDVYSLGVILYELLTGVRPFASDSRSPAEWERLVREAPAERPSTRVARHSDAGSAGACRSTPGALRRALRGDLDRIVLMALRKEPERRYASALELAEDVERHLAGQPIRAREASWLYVTSRFVRRHGLAVAAALAVVTALVLGLLAARRSERVAEAEALHAQLEADSFQGIASFLMDAFLPAQPAQDAAWQARARSQVLAQVERVERQYAGVDHQRANLLDALGRVCARLALLEEAADLTQRAAAIRERAFGAGSLEYALSLRSLGQLEFQAGDYARAARQLERALALHRAAGPSVHADVAAVANDLAACLRNLGRDAEAEALHREALGLRRAAGDHSLPVAESLNNLAGIHLTRGEFAAAITELREALAIRAAILGDDHALTLQTVANLAAPLWRGGPQAEARALMERAAAGYTALGADGEEGLALALTTLATMQLESRDLEAAAQSLTRARALQERRLGPEHPHVARTLARLAAVEHARHRDAEARTLWAGAVRIRRATPTVPRDLAEVLYGCGVFLFDVGDDEPAARLLREALDLHRTQALADDVGLGRAELVLGRCLLRLGQVEPARAHLTAAARRLDASPAATPEDRTAAHRALAELAPGAGR